MRGDRLKLGDLVSGIIVFAFALAIAYTHRESLKDETFMLDFEPYYLQAQLVWTDPIAAYAVQGAKQERGLRALVPLTYAALLSPLARLPQIAVEAVVLAVFCVLYALSVVLAARIAGLDGRLQLLFFLFALVYHPGVRGVFFGNLSVLLTFLMMGGIACYQRQRDLSFGVLIGIASAIKITPVFLCLYLALRGRFRAIFAAVAAFLAIAVLSALVIGPANYLYYWTDVFPELSSFRSPSIYNQSLIGVISRFEEAYGWHLPGLNQAVAVLLLGGFAAFASLRLRRRATFPPDAETPRVELYLLAINLLVINLATGIGWVHHFMWNILAMGLLLRDLRSIRRWLLFYPVLIANLIAVQPIELQPPWLANLIGSYFTFAELLLLALLAWMAWERRIDDPSTAGINPSATA